MDEKLSSLSINTLENKKERNHISLMPIPTPLKNQRVVELANKIDRKNFLTSIRNNIDKIIEKQNVDANCQCIFLLQSLNWFPKSPSLRCFVLSRLEETDKLFAANMTKEGIALIMKLRKQRRV
ncbi:hypothetical protein H8B06_17435 [Sphingobacterium sp. DN00404]|uniref:Uncharacterized protein n=1 Tax=Sphingobacterium micropteri TaxID=2763501 RepID=A0ABR7YTN3_9SPHI|nr:hypothetical protein [Sphingobacterium micropteri]MBD1434612.1 hypothetical protein [Sphingobacterium micropteri]